MIAFCCENPRSLITPFNQISLFVASANAISSLSVVEKVIVCWGLVFQLTKDLHKVTMSLLECYDVA